MCREKAGYCCLYIYHYIAFISVIFRTRQAGEAFNKFQHFMLFVKQGRDELLSIIVLGTGGLSSLWLYQLMMEVKNFFSLEIHSLLFSYCYSKIWDASNIVRYTVFNFCYPMRLILLAVSSLRTSSFVYLLLTKYGAKSLHSEVKLYESCISDFLSFVSNLCSISLS